jgi:hypothetical protein
MLLTRSGELIQKGYATSPILQYKRKNVALKLRLKEWDYYLINNDKQAVAVTIGKSSSLVLVSASLIDLVTLKEITKSTVGIVSEKRGSMPESSETGDIIYHNANTNFSFVHRNGNRELTLYMKGFINSEDLDISLILSHEPQDSLVIATPFYEGNKLFYYNRKIIGMRASGKARLGNRNFTFFPCNSFGLLDWGRGVWPYHTIWYWGAAQGMIGNNLFGFNLGYGFGDTSKATENMLFYNGVASKLEEVTFHIPMNNKGSYEYMEPWKITSSDDRLQMIFTPILDRSVNLSAVVLSTNQHQVFGTFTGMALLDDGTMVFIKNFTGFLERVENRW